MLDDDDKISVFDMFRGNPTSFCNYIFKEIIKGPNNHINFDTFLEAQQLLDPKDLDHALAAVSSTSRRKIF